MENNLFGAWSTSGDFVAGIRNMAVKILKVLEKGVKLFVDFLPNVNLIINLFTSPGDHLPSSM